MINITKKATLLQDGTTNEFFMRDQYIMNGKGVKGKIARVTGFYMSGDKDSNKTQANRRFFSVKVLGTDLTGNPWWLDMKDGSLNPDLYLFDQEQGKIIEAAFDALQEQKEEKKKLTKITEEHVDELLKNSTIESQRLTPVTCLVTCTLPNGYVIVETESCMNAETYVHEIGVEICMNKIKNKVWELEAYKNK